MSLWGARIGGKEICIFHGIEDSAHCKLYRVCFTLYRLHCIMYRVQCYMYSVECTLYRVDCELYELDCTVYSTEQTKTKYNVICRMCIVSKSYKVTDGTVSLLQQKTGV